MINKRVSTVKQGKTVQLFSPHTLHIVPKKQA
jgi:hypothetical protein